VDMNALRVGLLPTALQHVARCFAARIRKLMRGKTPMERNDEGMITLTDTDQVTEELGNPTNSAAGVGRVVVTDDMVADAFELAVDGRTAAGLLYSTAGTRVTLLATSVFPQFRGQGLASKLIGDVLDTLRTQGRTATLTCPFTIAFVASHPEYADVVDPVHPGAARRHGGQH